MKEDKLNFNNEEQKVLTPEELKAVAGGDIGVKGNCGRYVHLYNDKCPSSGSSPSDCLNCPYRNGPVPIIN